MNENFSYDGDAAEINETVKKLSHKKDAPKFVFAIILVLYIAASVALRKVASDRSMVFLFGARMPVQAFAGVFSSLSNVCLIFLAVFFGRVGFLTSLVILLVQFPMMAAGMILNRNFTTIPGVFSNILAIVAITVVYINHARVHKYQRRILAQAVTDRLTGLPNRFACVELMEDLAKRKKNFVAVAVELDNFKNINDTMGYDVGDKVLMKVAERWKALVDTFKGSDFAAHIDGNEFFLILSGLSSLEEVESALDSYGQVLEEKITIDSCDYFVNACFGWAAFPKDAVDSGSLFSCAEAAVREAKRRGDGKRVVKFEPEYIEDDKTLEMERKIRAALDNGNIYFCLQPQFHMNKTLRGFEALARMRDADGSVISPAEFIPVAEKVGLIEKIDARILSLASSFLARRITVNASPVVLCVNVSVRHLMKGDFVDELKGILNESGFPPDHLEIEITESILIESADKALECIRQVKNMGVKVAIDDFGTGYSSLSYLNKFPADALKIDKSFIDVMNDNASNKQYVGTIISIGHILNLTVISEGVESQEQLGTLKEACCDCVQGFVWGKPLEPEEAAKLM